MFTDAKHYLNSFVYLCLLIGISITVLQASPAQAALTLSVQANPDPVEPGEVVNIEITVTNSDGFDRTGVALEMDYPSDLANLSEGLITNGGFCTGGSLSGTCVPGELLNWSLGTIPAGTGITVSLPPTVAAATVPGTVIPFVSRVTDSTLAVISTTANVEVVTDRTLELVVTEAVYDPVVPGAELTYVLTYGHSAASATALNTVLELPVPPGLIFVSATDGGVLAGDVVQWALGTLNPGAGGERRVTFTVDPLLAPGTAIKTEATLADSGSDLTRADVVTRVEAAAPLTVSIDASPNPAQPGNVLTLDLTVTNTSAFARAAVVLQMRFPVGLQNLSHSSITGGGVCTGGSLSTTCVGNELLTWDLGTITAATSVSVSLPPAVSASIEQGRLIEFFAFVQDSTTRSRAAEVVRIGVNDSDNDGIPDDEDNCILHANGPLIPDAGGNVQLDTDGDNYGNICDPDLDNNLIVQAGDLAIFKPLFFTSDPDADFDGNGIVQAADLAILKTFFFKPPGPSGLVP